MAARILGVCLTRRLNFVFWCRVYQTLFLQLLPNHIKICIIVYAPKKKAPDKYEAHRSVRIMGSQYETCRM